MASEFHLSQSESFWKVRSRCNYLQLSCLGDKKELVQRYQQYLFANQANESQFDFSQLSNLNPMDICEIVQNQKSVYEKLLAQDTPEGD